MPARFRPDGGAPGSGPPQLLTHEELASSAPSGPPRPVPGPAGPGADRAAGAFVPPAGGRPPAARTGGGGDEPPRRWWALRREDITWRLVRRVLYVLLGLFVVVPTIAFAVGWMIFKVPSADDAAVTQVATFNYTDGSPLATVRPNNVNRTNVTLDQVPLPVQRAVLSAEDRSFFSNPGFDVSGIGRAVWSQLTGGIGGGSTITQQYIKVTTGQDQVSLWRKYREIVLAAKISKEQTKEQILENYLNAIYLGRGAYGIQAASQAYFGKNVQDMTPSEGAMIAGLIQSPSRWDPAKNPEKSLERWNFVMDGEVAQGWMTPVDRAAQVYPQWKQPSVNEGGIPGDSRGHIYNQVRAELEAKGITDQEINTEGLTVQTTIDPAKQQEAVDAVEKVMKSQPENLRTAVVSVDPKTGAVLAYYGGDNGVGLDYAQALKQPGSSFKPFVLAAALQQPDPIGLGTQYDGSSPQVLAGQKVSNSEGVSCGRCSVKTAMTQSINTVFYKMAIDVGPAAVAEAAHKAGIPANLLPADKLSAGIALGDKEVHPADMASAFATFAADGVYREPYLVSRVTTSDGRVIYDHGTGTAGTQAFPEQVARNVTESMTDVAQSSRIPLNGGRPVAAKTGTVQSSVAGQNNDAWTVGYTPSVSTAVWVGTDDNQPIKNSAGRPIYGRMLPGSIWEEYMNAVLSGTPREQFSAFDPIGQPPVSDATRSATPSTENQPGGNGDSGNSDGNGDSGNGDNADNGSGNGNGGNGSGSGGNGSGSGGNGNGGNGSGSGGNGNNPDSGSTNNADVLPGGNGGTTPDGG
ncbi:transglycosylase domain-containing protein [Pseudonocardia sp. T1-2H]|uniref:transglycosylase domain-containing protein n=1 Tax=Pseudonocardia sp. T1-2H TaxID=3128899 RepID=UPI00310155D7